MAMKFPALLGDDDAHERMRQRRRTQRPALVGAFQRRGSQSVGTADEERHVGALHAPARQLRGEILAAPGFAAPVERNDMRAFWDRRQHRGALLEGRARRIARSCGYFHKLQRQLARQPLGVLGVAFVDPARHALAHRYQVGAHQGG